MPFHASWLNRIEVQVMELRYFTLGGTDFARHREQGQMIHRYITWRNNHATHLHLRQVAAQASIIKKTKVA